MFWRMAGPAQASPIEAILDKDNFTLEELLDEDDFIQEVQPCAQLHAPLCGSRREQALHCRSSRHAG